MKKILFLTFIVLGFGACTDDLTDLNIDEKEPLEVPADALIANSLVELFDMMASTNVNRNNFRLWAQHWAQTSYPDESNYELVERDVNGFAWNKCYATIVKDASDARDNVLAEPDGVLSPAQKANQVAIIDLIEVMSYTLLVDLFGDVPYTEAFGGALPAYDDDEFIYGEMIKKLDSAIKNLGGSNGMGGNDVVFNGNGDAWKTFANSLKLRLAVRIGDKNPTLSKSMAEEAIAGGVMESNDDNFQITYSSSTPNTNPLWESLVQSGRSDFIGANTFIDNLNQLNDPRLPMFFKNQIMKINADTTIMGMDTTIVRDTFFVWQGGTYGAANSYANNSQPGEILEDPTLPGIILGYTEVAFLLADIAERFPGTTEKSAEEYYDAGVINSITEWGVHLDTAKAYLATPDVAYATAPGTWKQKIAMQKWIGLYNQGFEAWTTYRIYDHPTMNVADGAGTLPPTRYTYPRDEFDLNKVNMDAASAAIGGDDLFTKVFWDVN